MVDEISEGSHSVNEIVVDYLVLVVDVKLVLLRCAHHHGSHGFYCVVDSVVVALGDFVAPSLNPLACFLWN